MVRVARVRHATRAAAIAVAFTADGVLMSNREAPPFVGLEVRGEPRVQERHRINMRVPGHPTIWDPSGPLKSSFRNAVTRALIELGTDGRAFPLYAPGDAINITIVFATSNMAKDLDNLLKFVFDALQGVVYGNDRRILSVRAEKVQVQAGQGFTSIQVNAI